MEWTEWIKDIVAPISMVLIIFTAYFFSHFWEEEKNIDENTTKLVDRNPFLFFNFHPCFTEFKEFSKGNNIISFRHRRIYLWNIGFSEIPT